MRICRDSTCAFFLFQQFGVGKSNLRMGDSPSPQVWIGAGLQHLRVGISSAADHPLKELQ